MRQQKKKILIADADLSTIKLIRKYPQASLYQWEIVKDGFECLAKIETFQPDLILAELMLPKVHGIEILRKVKTDPRSKHIGVILMTAHIMIQNYKAATKQRCDFFLEKPFEPSRLYSLLKQFFSHTLHPTPFTGIESTIQDGKHCYVPKIHSSNTFIKFWGTRGSNPVSGSEYVRFGGNTCCLEIRYGKDLIIVDAGTGIRPLGSALSDAKTKQIHLLISHTHWDHLAGFPFFAPIYDPECHITIWTPIGFEKSTQELFTEMLAYAYFPVRLDDIQARLTFKEIFEGEPFQIGQIEIDTHYAKHPGATVCFKFQLGNLSFGYVTDNEFLMGFHGHPNTVTKTHPELQAYRSMVQFFKRCDLLVHEAQYTPAEYQAKVGWGHSSVANAAVLMKHAEIHDWIITHHDPKHTDIDLLAKTQLQLDILDDCKLAIHPRMAFDQLTLPL